MFDPSIGRWLEMDPIAFDAGDANLYRFGGNNPANVTDPSGLEWIQVKNSMALPVVVQAITVIRGQLIRDKAQLIPSMGSSSNIFLPGNKVLTVYDARNANRILAQLPIPASEENVILEVIPDPTAPNGLRLNRVRGPETVKEAPKEIGAPEVVKEAPKEVRVPAANVFPNLVGMANTILVKNSTALPVVVQATTVIHNQLFRNKAQLVQSMSFSPNIFLPGNKVLTVYDARNANHILAQVPVPASDDGVAFEVTPDQTAATGIRLARVSPK